MADRGRPTVAVVFARGGSKGVPRKNLQAVGGISLVGRAVDAAVACVGIDRVLVSTDDEEIVAVAEAHGAEAPWRRPRELAADDAPEWLAWQHAVRTEEEAGRPIGTLVSVPPTAPLRRPVDIAAALGRFAAGDVDAVVTATPARRHPAFNLVRLDDQGHAVLADPAGRAVRRQDVSPLYDLATVAYVADAAFVARADRLLDGRVGMALVPEKSALDIDTEHDLLVARLLVAQDAGMGLVGL